MELRHLRYFLAVAEELHFARAAERLHIAQQSLRAQMRQLEAEVGTALFERTTRRVELSPAGQVFLSDVEQLFAHLERGITRARKAGSGDLGRLVVGYHSTTLATILPMLVRRFREQFPEVEVVLQEAPSPELEERILAGSIDVGISALSEGQSAELDQALLYRDSVAVALPKGHRLEDCEGIPLAALRGESFVLYSRISKRQAFDQIIALCQSRGFSPQIAQEAANENAVISLVASGIGVALVVKSLQQREDEVTYRPLVDPTVIVDLGMIWRRDALSPAAQRFLQTARELS